MASSSSGGSFFNTGAIDPARPIPPHRYVTSFADLLATDTQEQQPAMGQPNSLSGGGEMHMNSEPINNIHNDQTFEIPNQMCFSPPASFPLTPPVSPSFCNSFFVDHFPDLLSPSYVPPSATMENFDDLMFSMEEETWMNNAGFSSSFSAGTNPLDSLTEKDEAGRLNSQTQLPTEPAAPLQGDVPSIEEHTSVQDTPPVKTRVHGNSASARHKRKSDDGYPWRKYGEKPLKGSNNPRSYYKCNYPKCPSKKKVECDLNGNVADVIYRGTHNHPKPEPPKRTSSNSLQNPMPNNIGGQNPMSNNIGSGIPMGNNIGMPMPENPQTNIGEGSSRDDDEINELKAKRWRGQGKSASRSRITAEHRIVIETTSDVKVLDDGYRWRKYGEKPVKNNTNPRSYYKCSSNGCNVRKQVERSPNDSSLVVTTYEGKHNHGIPAQRISVTYPPGRLPIMSNYSSPTARTPSATSSHSDPTMPQTMQNQTPNANEMQQKQSVEEEPNDDLFLDFDDSFFDDLFI